MGASPQVGHSSPSEATWNRKSFLKRGGSERGGGIAGHSPGMGTPLSWKKTHLAEVNTWLGFVVHPNIPQVLMAANKHILVMEVLQIMVEGQAMHLKDIEKALGRIQWATAACPLAKSMLQPLWAWKMATTTVGKPPKVVRMLAFMLSFRPVLPLLAEVLMVGLQRR